MWRQKGVPLFSFDADWDLGGKECHWVVFFHTALCSDYLWFSGTILTIENFDKNIRVQSDCYVRLLVNGWFPFTNTAGCVFEVHIKFSLVCKWMPSNTHTWVSLERQTTFVMLSYHRRRTGKLLVRLEQLSATPRFEFYLWHLRQTCRPAWKKELILCQILWLEVIRITPIREMWPTFYCKKIWLLRAYVCHSF